MIYIEIIGLVARSHLTKDVFSWFCWVPPCESKKFGGHCAPTRKGVNMLGRIWWTLVHQQNGKTTQKLRWVWHGTFVTMILLAHQHALASVAKNVRESRGLETSKGKGWKEPQG